MISVLIIQTASGASSQSNATNYDCHQQPSTNQLSCKHNVAPKIANNQSNTDIPLQSLNAHVPLTSSHALHKAAEQGTKLIGRTVNTPVNQTLVSSSDDELDELICVTDSQPTKLTSSAAQSYKSAVPSVSSTTSASRAVTSASRAVTSASRAVTSASANTLNCNITCAVTSTEMLNTVSYGNRTDNVTNASKTDTVSCASIKPCVVSAASSNILSSGNCYSTSAAINSSIQPESKHSPLKCSQDDITKKRLEALKRREQSMMAKLGTCSASQVKRDWEREKETLKEISSLSTTSNKGRVLPAVQHVMGKETSAKDNLQNDHVTLYSNRSYHAANHSSHSNQHAALNNNISSKCTQEEIERKRQEAMKKKSTRLRIKNNQNNT